MFFFNGDILEFKKVKQKEDTWKGEKLIPIEEVLSLLVKSKHFPKYLKKYRETQLNLLQSIQHSKKLRKNKKNRRIYLFFFAGSSYIPAQ